jgi:hypothetical protein
MGFAVEFDPDPKHFRLKKLTYKSRIQNQTVAFSALHALCVGGTGPVKCTLTFFGGVT